ncbi:hypothetical protein WJX74_006915 [Apatococcus lobatus]|uniref:Uncharacterized protein n=2 Tax=Apatococcus TaxID=904362 RepID=A0AAW1SZ56_9CHLO
MQVTERLEYCRGYCVELFSPPGSALSAIPSPASTISSQLYRRVTVDYRLPVPSFVLFGLQLFKVLCNWPAKYWLKTSVLEWHM